MSLLNFRRARGLAATAAANIRTYNWGSARGRPMNGAALSMITLQQREILSLVERRGTHQLASRLGFHTKSMLAPSQRTVSRPTLDGEQSRTNYGRRFFSFYDDPPNANQKPNMGNPAYTVYGEEIAFTLKAIPPEFRSLPSGTVILDASKRGRLLFEWTPLASGHDDGYGSGNRKYRWDASTRFALTAEEAGSLLAKLDRGDPSVEFSRRVSGDSMGQSLDKVFIAKMIELEGTKNDGISLLMDYVDSDKQQLGQVPHPQSGEASDGAFGNEGLVGPFEIRLMVGEYQVLRSIIEYSLPKLVGWSTMFDRNVEQAVNKSVQGHQRGYGGGSPHNYQGGGGGGY